jgi:hypothetical protein
LDSSRLRTGEIVAGSGGAALFVFLFFDWFSGGAELTGSAGNLSLSTTGISGWNALTDLPGFLIILSAVSGIALAILAATGQRINIPVRRGMITALLGTLAVLLILWRMVAGTPTLKIGIFLGLAAATAIAVGALMALAEDGWQPLVAVPGGRTRVASASAPPAKPAAPQAEAPTETRSSSSGGSTATKKSATKRSTTKKSSGSRSKSKSSTTKKKSASKSSGSKSSTTRSRSSKPKSKSSSARSRSSGSKARSGSSKKKK